MRLPVSFPPPGVGSTAAPPSSTVAPSRAPARGRAGRPRASRARRRGEWPRHPGSKGSRLGPQGARMSRSEHAANGRCGPDGGATRTRRAARPCGRRPSRGLPAAVDARLTWSRTRLSSYRTPFAAWPRSAAISAASACRSGDSAAAKAGSCRAGDPSASTRRPRRRPWCRSPTAPRRHYAARAGKGIFRGPTSGQFSSVMVLEAAVMRSRRAAAGRDTQPAPDAAGWPRAARIRGSAAAAAGARTGSAAAAL